MSIGNLITFAMMFAEDMLFDMFQSFHQKSNISSTKHVRGRGIIYLPAFTGRDPHPLSMTKI